MIHIVMVVIIHQSYVHWVPLHLLVAGKLDNVIVLKDIIIG
jgi:hypothetical protein